MSQHARATRSAASLTAVHVSHFLTRSHFDLIWCFAAAPAAKVAVLVEQMLGMTKHFEGGHCEDVLKALESLGECRRTVKFFHVRLYRYTTSPLPTAAVRPNCTCKLTALVPAQHRDGY